MAFLDSFKKNEVLYILMLAIGVVIVTLNNLAQFYEMVLTNIWLSLLSLILLVFTVIYIIKNKEEVFK